MENLSPYRIFQAIANQNIATNFDVRQDEVARRSLVATPPTGFNPSPGQKTIISKAVGTSEQFSISGGNNSKTNQLGTKGGVNLDLINSSAQNTLKMTSEFASVNDSGQDGRRSTLGNEVTTNQVSQQSRMSQDRDRTGLQDGESTQNRDLTFMGSISAMNNRHTPVNQMIDGIQG